MSSKWVAIITYWDGDDGPHMTAFDNNIAAKKYYEWCQQKGYETYHDVLPILSSWENTKE